MYSCNIEYSGFIKLAWCETRSFFKLFKLLKGFLYNLLNWYHMRIDSLKNWKSLYIENKNRFEKKLTISTHDHDLFILNVITIKFWIITVFTVLSLARYCSGYIVLFSYMGKILDIVPQVKVYFDQFFSFCLITLLAYVWLKLYIKRLLYFKGKIFY